MGTTHGRFHQDTTSFNLSNTLQSITSLNKSIKDDEARMKSMRSNIRQATATQTKLTRDKQSLESKLQSIQGVPNEMNQVMKDVLFLVQTLEQRIDHEAVWDAGQFCHGCGSNNGGCLDKYLYDISLSSLEKVISIYLSTSTINTFDTQVLNTVMNQVATIKKSQTQAHEAQIKAQGNTAVSNAEKSAFESKYDWSPIQSGWFPSGNDQLVGFSNATNLSASSMQECMNFAMKNPQMEFSGISFTNQNKRCYFKKIGSVQNGITYDGSWQSVYLFKKGDWNPQQQGWFAANNDVQTLASPSWQLCESECSKNAQCSGFTFNSVQNKCWLKNQDGVKVFVGTTGDWISASKKSAVQSDVITSGQKKLDYLGCFNTENSSQKGTYTPDPENPNSYYYKTVKTPERCAQLAADNGKSDHYFGVENRGECWIRGTEPPDVTRKVDDGQCGPLGMPFRARVYKMDHGNDPPKNLGTCPDNFRYNGDWHCTPPGWHQFATGCNGISYFPPNIYNNAAKRDWAKNACPSYKWTNTEVLQPGQTAWAQDVVVGSQSYGNIINTVFQLLKEFQVFINCMETTGNAKDYHYVEPGTTARITTFLSRIESLANPFHTYVEVQRRLSGISQHISQNQEIVLDNQNQIEGVLTDVTTDQNKIQKLQNDLKNDEELLFEMEEIYLQNVGPNNAFTLFKLKPSAQSVIWTPNGAYGDQTAGTFAVPTSIARPLLGARVVRLMTNSNNWTGICAKVSMTSSDSNFVGLGSSMLPYKDAQAKNNVLVFKNDPSCGCPPGWRLGNNPLYCAFEHLPIPDNEHNSGCGQMKVQCNDGSIQKPSGHYSKKGHCNFSDNHYCLPENYSQDPYSGQLWNYACGGGHGGVRRWQATGSDTIICKNGEENEWNGAVIMASSMWHNVQQIKPKDCAWRSMVVGEQAAKALGDLESLSFGVLSYYRQPPRGFDLFGFPSGWQVQENATAKFATVNNMKVFLYRKNYTPFEQQTWSLSSQSISCTPPKMKIEWFGPILTMNESVLALASWMIAEDTYNWDTDDANMVSGFARGYIMKPTMEIQNYQFINENAPDNDQNPWGLHWVVPVMSDDLDGVYDVWIHFESAQIGEWMEKHVEIKNWGYLPKSVQTYIVQQWMPYYWDWQNGRAKIFDVVCAACGLAEGTAKYQIVSHFTGGLLPSPEQNCSNCNTFADIVGLLCDNINTQSMALYVQVRAKQMLKYKYPVAWSTGNDKDVEFIQPLEILQLYPAVYEQLKTQETFNVYKGIRYPPSLPASIQAIKDFGMAIQSVLHNLSLTKKMMFVVNLSKGISSTAASVAAEIASEEF